MRAGLVSRFASRLASIASLAPLLALAACYSPAEAPCTIHCAATDVCPGDETCAADGFCHAPDDTERCVGFTVSIALAGGGHGVVRSTPAGLDCDGSTGCTATFPAGTALTLTATPGSAARLAAWSGPCATSDLAAGTCAFSVETDLTVGATFNRTARLEVAIDPARKGQGTITSEPPGIACPGVACGADFDAGANVVLTATAASGSRFGAWTSCAASSGAACTVPLANDATATAQFIRTPTVGVTITGTTDYAVASQPTGLTCTGTRCTGVFDQGQAVQLTAADGVASHWKSWTGCLATGACTVVVDDADVEVGAVYKDLVDITAVTTGSGVGTIAATGLPCNNGSCVGTYEVGATVVITAQAAPGSRFAGWTGCDSLTGMAGEICVVMPSTARTVSVAYVRERAVVIDFVGTGAGSVTVAGFGTCSADCTVTVDQGPVTLTAAPSSGSRTGGWSGGCTSATASCATTVVADVATAVSFVRQRTLTVVAPAGATVTSALGACVGPATCPWTVDSGATVALTVTTAPGQQVEWSNACTGASCTVTVSADQTITVGLDGGHAIWARTLARNESFRGEYADAVAAAPDGDVIWAGHATAGGGLDFGGALVPIVTPNTTSWVARYSGAGAHRWSRAFSASLYVAVSSACITASGDVVVGGTVNGTISLGAVSATARPSGNDGFVARLDGATGAAQWIVTVGGPAAGDQVDQVVCDGEAVLLRYAGDGPDYQVSDGGAISDAPAKFFGVARLDAAGHHVWSKVLLDRANDTGYSRVAGLAVGAADDLYIAGEYSQVFDFGGGPLPFPGQHPDGFALRLVASTGAHVWSRGFGTIPDQGAADCPSCWPHVTATAVDGAGGLAIAGYVEAADGTRFNLGTLAAPVRVTVHGASEMFVARFARAGGAPLDGFGLGSAAATGREIPRALCASGADLIVRADFTTAAVAIGA
ncbi:MAG: hypothetical protein K8W52_39660, partial [Deltaproteobacteria bacterium]|nr:hypothetical protein [Deltaproteobacteria bacterium]